MTQKTTVDVTGANQPNVDQTNHEPPDSEEATGSVEGGVEGGVVGGVVGKTSPLDNYQTNTTSDPNTAVGFSSEMTPPKQISGPPLNQGITGVSGTAWIGRCIIKPNGVVSNCEVLLSIPAIDEQLVKNLEAQKYSPVIHRGRPQAVRYTFKLKFK